MYAPYRELEYEVYYLDNPDNDAEKWRDIPARDLADARRIVDDLIVGGADINRTRARQKVAKPLRSTQWEIVKVERSIVESGTHQFNLETTNE